MRRWSVGSLLATLAVCALAWAVVAAACLCVGSTTSGLHWPASVETLRLRRASVLPASLIGAALAAAGVAYQAVLRNPLADPYLLGVSSGASLAAYLWRLTPTAALAAAAAVAGQQAFALAGAVACVAVVFALSTRRGRLEPVTLLLVGVIVNAVNGSVFLLVNAVDVDRAGPNGGAIGFLVGGIQPDLTTGQLGGAAMAVGVGWLALMYLAGQLNAAALDETEAAALGVRVHRLRWVALGVASAMTAAAVAVSGPIGFVGLICPHVARRLVGPDPRRALPVATAAGAILLAVADAASRLLSSPDYAGTLLPVGVLTGLLGGPFFLLLLWQSRRRTD
jgi:iron complex transport system permease protein